MSLPTGDTRGQLRVYTRRQPYSIFSPRLACTRPLGKVAARTRPLPLWVDDLRTPRRRLLRGCGTTSLTVQMATRRWVWCEVYGLLWWSSGVRSEGSHLLPLLARSPPDFMPVNVLRRSDSNYHKRGVEFKLRC